MRLVLRSSAWTAFSGALLAAVVLASTAGAVTLRSPQVAFQNASLQGYLNANDGGINTATDQIVGENYATNISGNTDFTLMVKLGGNATLNTIGVYNAGDASPVLYQLFPASAVANYSVYCHFKSTGQLLVDLYDQNGLYLGTTSYSGVTRSQFGFYIQGPGGLFYSQDARNGGNAQMLTYAGTGDNAADLWECFADTPYSAATSTFENVVLLVESIVPKPVPTNNKTWGSIKSSYR